MNSFSISPYRKLFYIALLVQVVTAWFSVGYFHPDEHFQILEFCNYKLGFSSPNDLPWEYAAQCRSAIQPLIAFTFSKILLLVGLYNPSTVAFLLRLLIGVLSWWVCCRLILLLLPGFKSEKGKRFFVVCSLFLWFVPYLTVRFTAENMSELFFLAAILIILSIKNLNSNKRLFYLSIAGLFLGFIPFLRLQMGFSLVALAIWIVLIKKMHWKDCVILVLSALVATVISILIDRWFYGTWVLTPYNYFNQNIVKNVAAQFGVFPWWFYFTSFIKMAVIPISIVLLLLFFKGLLEKPFNLFSLVCIIFLIGHCIIGHKEMRFLFPISFAFIYVASIGMDSWINKISKTNFYKWGIRVLFSLNIFLLIFKMFTPSEEIIKYYNFIYAYAKKQPTTIISFEKSPFFLYPLEVNFYKPNNIKIIVLKKDQDIDTIVKKDSIQSFIYLSKTLQLPKELSSFHIEKLYCQFPDWVLKYNINHWEDRSYIWTVYKLTPKQ